jgi:predicted amidohydrolase
MRLVLSQPSHRGLGKNSHIRSMMRLVERSNLALEPEDVLVLPEQVGGHASERDYVDDVAWLARSCGCHVVGGSHIRETDQGLVNCGVVTDGSGSILAEYEKANPYGPELEVEACH